MAFIENSKEPFCLMVNFPDAHLPFIENIDGLPVKIVKPSEIDGTLPFVGADSKYLREYTAKYYTCINRLDECVGMLLAGDIGAKPSIYYPKRSVRDTRFKLIHNLHYWLADPFFKTDNDRDHESSTSIGEIYNLPDDMKQVYHILKCPPEYKLYDLLNDPWEFRNLSTDPGYKKELEHLKSVLKRWQFMTDDPFINTEKHNKFNFEIEEIVKNNQNYLKDPSFIFKYIDYFRYR
jgi:hypothetical protein